MLQCQARFAKYAKVSKAGIKLRAWHLPLFNILHHTFNQLSDMKLIDDGVYDVLQGTPASYRKQIEAQYLITNLGKL